MVSTKQSIRLTLIKARVDTNGFAFGVSGMGSARAQVVRLP